MSQKRKHNLTWKIMANWDQKLKMQADVFHWRSHIWKKYTLQPWVKIKVTKTLSEKTPDAKLPMIIIIDIMHLICSHKN